MIIITNEVLEDTGNFFVKQEFVQKESHTMEGSVYK